MNNMNRSIYNNNSSIICTIKKKLINVIFIYILVLFSIIFNKTYKSLILLDGQTPKCRGFQLQLINRERHLCEGFSCNS